MFKDGLSDVSQWKEGTGGRFIVTEFVKRISSQREQKGFLDLVICGEIPFTISASATLRLLMDKKLLPPGTPYP